MGKIKVVGLDKLEKALKDNITMDDVKRVIRNNGAGLQNKMQVKADFKGHWGYKDGSYQFIPPTGETKRSIMLDISDFGLTAEVEPTTEYAAYLEYGTRFMEAQSFVRPALEEQSKKFKKDMEKLVK